MPFPPTHPALERALAARGYAEPTSVQEAVLQPAAHERDLLVSAQTGSGKTVAYGLAFASTILGDAPRLPPAGPPLVLVIAPTRELAIQVHGELSWLYFEAGGQVVSCVGGMDARREARALQVGSHIVVGTPGRLRDHLERGQLDVSALRVLVLDEADEMLDLGFRDELQFILDATPAARRTLLFSATIAREIAALARDYQRDALRIDTVARNQPHGDIEYRALRVAPNEIEHALVNVLRHSEARALVFCATREAVRRLHGRLIERGFAAVALSGELSQTERSTALQSLRDGRARVCIATDVAARGLDLPDLELVIHADMPTNKATLLHRSGRTGRAGKKGLCLLLVPYNKRRRAEMLLASASIAAVWADPPSADDIRVRDAERLLSDPVLTEPAQEEDLVLARQLLEQQSPEAIAAALVRMYRARLPAPEDLFVAPAQSARPERGEPAERPERRERFERDAAPVGDGAGAGGPMVWFRMAVGRANNADPKWLIPLICRIGHVTKKDIGAIRIFGADTKFEIVAETATRFAAAVAAATDAEIRIEPAAAAPAPRSDKPRGYAPRPDAAPARRHKPRARA